MKIKEIIEICNKAIPREVEYSQGEMYGAVSVPDQSLEVEKVLYCVTPSDEVAKYFHDNDYDMVVSHHPMTFTDKTIPHLVYHTALDCCEGGLNDMWADALELKKDTMKHFDKELGWFGELEIPMKFNDLIAKVEGFAGDVEGQIYCKGNKLIKTVVICSGLGGMVTDVAAKTGADCYILGEAIDNADMMGFDSVIETGHTNSEWQGVNFFVDLLEPLGLKVFGTPLTIDVYGEEHFVANQEFGGGLFAGGLGGDVNDIDYLVNYDYDADKDYWWPEDTPEQEKREFKKAYLRDMKSFPELSGRGMDEWSEAEIEDYYERLEEYDRKMDMG